MMLDKCILPLRAQGLQTISLSGMHVRMKDLIHCVSLEAVRWAVKYVILHSISIGSIVGSISLGDIRYVSYRMHFRMLHMLLSIDSYYS